MDLLGLFTSLGQSRIVEFELLFHHLRVMSVFFYLGKDTFVFLNSLLEPSNSLFRLLGVFQELSSLIKLATNKLVFLFQILSGLQFLLILVNSISFPGKAVSFCLDLVEFVL